MLSRTEPTRVNPKAAIESALRTVRIETEGLSALAEALDNGLATPFAEAVKLLSGIAGRVIVTGVGKSGHIGSKIAATLASTGTPANFVHPVEASHGDLGMITGNDAVLALSWSGESEELKGIVSYSRRFSIPLVAVTSGTGSALARQADIVLALPRTAEACPHGLAPTTSTLQQLALGDALAVAMLEARGFTPDNFRTFHPGGRLGASLTRLREFMHVGDELPLVPVGTLLPDAVLTLSAKRFGCVCIVDGEQRLVGIITDGDLARHLDRNMAELRVEDLMTTNPKTAHPDMLSGVATGLINDHNISALVVVDDNDRPVGIVHFHDLLRIGAA
jgi:arabinose-5-phosphate isomerase